MHGARLSVAMLEIMWLVISIGALSIVGLVVGLFGEAGQQSGTPKESDSEQGAFDDPHSEEWTR